MPATIAVQCRTSGSRSIPAVWVGQHLAVHRPLTADGLSKASRHWTITHTASGLAVIGGLNAAKNDAIALARLWDEAAALIDPAAPRQWRYLPAWRDDLQRIGIVPLVGPVDLIASATTAEHVIWQAMGYDPASDDEAAEQYPAAETVPANRLRDGADGMEMLWRGQWWTVPTFGEVEAWALDSLAETPDGRTVEPDHPESWPHLLGVV